MPLALAWGFIAGSSLIIGGLLALHLMISRRTLGYIMAFGSGVLMSAIAYELVEEAVETLSHVLWHVDHRAAGDDEQRGYGAQ